MDAQVCCSVETSMGEQSTSGSSSSTQSQRSSSWVPNEDRMDYSVIDVPVDKDSLKYNMNHNERGKAFIFHHTMFDSNLELEERGGDEDLLKSLNSILASRLEFSVTVFENLCYKKIKEEIMKLAAEDHKNRDCILIVFMTHGSNDKLYASNTHYNPDSLRSEFTTDKCPTLAGKPKIFIIQACRGALAGEGISFTHPPIARTSSTETDGSSVPYKMSRHADFLVVNSTVLNYISYRTWFIEALCDVLDSEENREDDFLSMMTTVQRKVAILEVHLRDKQIPSLTTQLTRKIYFKPK